MNKFKLKNIGRHFIFLLITLIFINLNSNLKAASHTHSIQNEYILSCHSKEICKKIKNKKNIFTKTELSFRSQVGLSNFFYRINLNSDEKNRLEKKYNKTKNTIFLEKNHSDQNSKIELLSKLRPSHSTKISTNKYKSTKSINRSNSIDPLFPLQWGLSNNGENQTVTIDDVRNKIYPGKVGEDIEFTKYQKSISQITTPIKKIKVAIIDSGIDINHPDLKDLIKAHPLECQKASEFQACLKNKEKTKKECNDIYAKLDMDNNGYPLDCHGWNVAAPISNVTKIQGNTNIEDLIGHGTHVAGVIGAKQNNQIGISGITNNIEIIPVKVNGSNESTPQDETPTDIFAKALLYAIKSEAQVINMSFGWKRFQDSKLMKEMVELAISKNIILVAASGNDGSNKEVFPCAYQGVICVGGYNPDGKKTSSSNHGSSITINAPSLNILSTYPMKLESVFFLDERGYEYMTGNSHAAPFVTGAFASLLSIGFDPLQAKLAIIKMANASLFDENTNDQFPKLKLNESLKSKWVANKTPYIFLENKGPISVNIIEKISNQSPLRIQLTNLGSSIISPFTLTLNSQYQEINFIQQNSTFDQWLEGETKSITFNIKLSDGNLPSEIPYEIKVKSHSGQTFQTIKSIMNLYHQYKDDIDQKPYQNYFSYQSLKLNTQLPESFGQDTSFFNFRPIGNSITNRSDGTFLGIKTINKKTQLTIISPDLEENKYNVHLINNLEIENPIFINASILDVNFDGKNDYFIYLLARFYKGTSVSGNPIYEYQSHFFILDHELKPLVNYPLPQKGFANKEFILSSRMVWIKKNNYLTPMWLSKGKLPETQFPKTPWDDLNNKNFSYSRIYYFNKELNIESLYPNQKGDFVYLIPQNKVDINNNTFYAIFAEGQGFAKDYFYLVIQNGQVTKKEKIEFPNYQDLEAAQIIPVSSNDDMAKIVFLTDSLPGQFYAGVININKKNHQKNLNQSLVIAPEDISIILGILPDHLYENILFQDQESLFLYNSRTNLLKEQNKFYNRSKMIYGPLNSLQSFYLSQNSSKNLYSEIWKISQSQGPSGDKMLSLNSTGLIKSPANCFEMGNENTLWGQSGAVFFVCPQTSSIIKLSL